MKQRPILFSTPMVQAILTGNKKQTRRTIKEAIQPGWELIKFNEQSTSVILKHAKTNKIKAVGCPYGVPGEILWVREKFRKLVNCETGAFARFDFYAGEEDFFTHLENKGVVVKWKPSIHMPKEAARLWLRIINVRVEQLQSISYDDAVSEGIEEVHPAPFLIRWKNYMYENSLWDCPEGSFCSLWQSINGEQSWNSNPWVWVVEFEKIEKPENY